MFLLTEAFSVFFFPCTDFMLHLIYFCYPAWIAVLAVTPCCPKLENLYSFTTAEMGSLDSVGLLCSRLHVMMSWVLNVSVTRHDKLSQHPRRHLYTSVIDDYTAWLIHFKTLLYGNLWHSFRLPSPCRGTVDFKCHSNITCVCVCQFVCTTLFKVIQLRSRHLSKIMLHC